MKIITWNVNSIRLRSNLIYKILELENPEILCLQECKSPTENMTFDIFEPLGYKYSACWGQKSYNGVAFISKVPLTNVETKDFLHCGEARHISIVVNGVTIHNFNDLDQYNDLENVAALAAALDVVVSTHNAVPIITAGVGTLTKLASWRQSPWNNILRNPRGPRVEIFERDTWESWENVFRLIAKDITSSMRF